MKYPLCLILFLCVATAYTVPAWADPVPQATPEPAPVTRVQTLIADKNLRLTFTGVPPECPLLRIALLRKDPLLPGYGAFNRPVRVDQTRGRVVTLVLGPEFQPHSYGAGDLRLHCYDGQGKPLQSLSNRAPLALDQAEITLDISTAFGPGVSDEKAN